jgi:tetratricopeptide (TPR) repeat protein
MQRGEPSRQARARLQLGHVEATAANPDRARRAYEEAISLSAADDRMTEAEAVQSLGQLARQENKEDAARDHYTRARRLYIETGDRRGEASVCIALAQLEAAAGRPDEARSAYDAALGIYLQQGMQEAQGRTLLEIGDLEKGRGRTEQAQDAYTRALGAYRLRLDKSGQAKALDRLGDLVEGTDPSLSQRYRSQAASLRNELQRGNAAAGAAPR